MNSIDYGLGMTNIDNATGIRYGVIHHGEVGQYWYDSSEADYGVPHCPECGNEVEEYDSTTQDEYEQYGSYSGCEYACDNCEHKLDSSDCYGDDPVGHILDDGEYKASQGSDHDIFILSSPYYTLCEYCSPCAPGAGYLVNEGDVKAYCFGHDWFEDGKAPYKVFDVKTGLEVLPVAS